jgi:hypothetical protein
MAKETLSLPDDDAALQEKAANLIDDGCAFANKARPYPVQCLQIELLIGLGWNKARRRSLHGLGHSMSISKIILVSLPKQLRIGPAQPASRRGQAPQAPEQRSVLPSPLRFRLGRVEVRKP